MHKREGLKKTAIHTGSTDDWNAYRKIRKKVTYEVKRRRERDLRSYEVT